MQSCGFMNDLFKPKKEVKERERVVVEESVEVEEVKWRDATIEDKVLEEYPAEKVVDESRPIRILCIFPFEGNMENRMSAFYSGFKQAGLKFSGNYSFDVTAMDIAEIINTPSVLPKLVDRENADVIVLPYSSSNINEILKYAKRSNIPVISPWNTSNEIDFYKGYIKLNPDLNTHLIAMAEYAVRLSTANNTLILTEKKDANMVDQMLKANSDIQHLYTSSNPKDDIARIQSSIEAHDISSVIIPSWRSSDEAFFISLLSALNAARQGKVISVFALSSWMNSQKINFDQFSELNLHFTSSRFLDNTIPIVSRFEENYYNQYKYFANESVFYGYDVFSIIAQLFSQYGYNWLSRLNEFSCSDCFFRYRIQENINAEGTSYFENRHVDIISLKNFQYNRVN
ncbi:hypothetical protein GCM10025777_13440 [Membranihabitans marinus]